MRLAWSARRTGLLLAAALIVLAAGVVTGRLAGPPPALPVFLCHDTSFGATPNAAVSLHDHQFQPDELVNVGRSKLLCEPVEKKLLYKDPQQVQRGDHLQCYRIDRILHGGFFALDDQLGTKGRVEILSAPYLCEPTDKGIEH